MTGGGGTKLWPVWLHMQTEYKRFSVEINNVRASATGNNCTLELCIGWCIITSTCTAVKEGRFYTPDKHQCWKLLQLLALTWHCFNAMYQLKINCKQVAFLCISHDSVYVSYSELSWKNSQCRWKPQKLCPQNFYLPGGKHHFKNKKFLPTIVNLEYPRMNPGATQQIWGLKQLKPLSHVCRTQTASLLKAHARHQGRELGKAGPRWPGARACSSFPFHPSRALDKTCTGSTSKRRGRD